MCHWLPPSLRTPSLYLCNFVHIPSGSEWLTNTKWPKLIVLTRPPKQERKMQSSPRGRLRGWPMKPRVSSTISVEKQLTDQCLDNRWVRCKEKGTEKCRYMAVTCRGMAVADANVGCLVWKKNPNKGQHQEASGVDLQPREKSCECICIQREKRLLTNSS